jgi:hypothetical protein
MSNFDTLSDVARIYNLPADRFLNEIEKAIQSELQNL